MLLLGCLSDGLPESQFPRPVYGGRNEPKFGGNITDITKLMSECKSIGINTLGPDVNISRRKFSVDVDGNIRFGLGAVKGLGDSAVDAIVKERGSPRDL